MLPVSTRQNFCKYVVFIQNNYVNHGFLNMDIAVAGCFGQRQKENSCILVHEDYRCNKNQTYERKAFSSDNRGVNVRLKRKKWRNFEVA